MGGDMGKRTQKWKKEKEIIKLLNDDLLDYPKILVIDDDPLFRRLITNIAMRRGIQIKTYGSVAEGWGNLYE